MLKSRCSVGTFARAIRIAIIALTCVVASLAEGDPARATEVAPRLAYYEPSDVILVLGAVPQEVRPYVVVMKDARRKSVWGIRYWSGHIGGKAVDVALTGIGKVNASTVTTALIAALKPRIALMSGTGSRPNPDVRTGDVIVATTLFEHDAGSLTSHDMVYRNSVPLQPPAWLLAKADAAIVSYKKPSVTANGSTYTVAVRRGVIATSDLFGVTNVRVRTLETLFHADIMEMESAAFARSCMMLGVPYLVVRAGSNVSQERPSDDYKRLGPIAAKQAAYFGIHLLNYL